MMRRLSSFLKSSAPKSIQKAANSHQEKSYRTWSRKKNPRVKKGGNSKILFSIKKAETVNVW